MSDDLPRRSALGVLRKVFFSLLWLSLIACGLVLWDTAHFLRTPGSAGSEPPLAVVETWYNNALKGVLPWDVPKKEPSEPKDVIISIEAGATFDRVAWDLKKAGAISNVFRFRLLGKYENALGGVRAGEYLVNTGWTPEQVLYQITKGRAVLYRLSLREGLTWWETAAAVEEQGFAKAADLSAVLRDPAFLAAHNIPFADAEGFLLPETYLLKKPKTLDAAQAKEMAAFLVESFWTRTEPVWSRLPVRQGGTVVERRFAPDGSIVRPSRNGTVTSASGNDATASGERNATVPSGSRNGTTPSPRNGTVPSASSVGAAPSDSPETALPTGSRNATAPAQGATPPATPPSVAISGPARPEDIDPAALKRLVILASLVERETAVPSERARVAGVYALRLEKGMLLQCDPTIIYGVGPSFTGAIRRSQLDDEKNLYNTYIHPGLPPGPICSPGLEALKAALNPEKHEYLYFVAKGTDGGHTFSKNLADHNKAVQEYRRTQGR